MPLFNANIDLDNNQLQNAVVHSGSTKPSSGLAAGQIFYDTDSNQLQLYTGSDWEGVVTETKDSTTITDVTSILNTSLVVGRDSTDQIKFSTNDQIIFRVGNADGVIFKASGEIEATSLDISGDVDIAGTLTLGTTLAVAEGGTGATSFADKSVIITQDSGTDTLAAVAMSTNGQLLIGGTSGPAVAVPTGGDGLTVTVGDGTLEYDLDAALTTVTSILATDLKIGEDDQTKIDFETADTINFYAGNEKQLILTDGALTPGSNAIVDLGTDALEFKDAYFDGTVEADALTIGGENIVSGGVITTLGTIAQDTVLFTSANADDPVLQIKNTNNSAGSQARLHLIKDRGAAAVQLDDIGSVKFIGENDAQEAIDYGEIFVEIGASGSAADTDEAGIMALKVATSDGSTSGLRAGISLEGSTSADTVDVALGSGTASTVTIAGNLQVNGTTTTVNQTIIESTVDVLVFEGANDDAHETTLKVVEPTADCTFALPTLSAGDYFIPAIAGTATDASAAVTAAEFALLDGGSTVGTTAVANGDGIFTNDGGTMRHTTVQTFQTYFDANSVGGGNIVTTGALNSGSITSGFGSINNGSSAITTTGLISGGSLDIDNVLINGTTIGHTDDTDLMTVADGLLTVAGEISVTTLDIGGTNVTATAAEINLIAGGTTRGTTAVADGDGLLVNDGGTMRMTSVQTVRSYMLSSLTSVGALNEGSITSGFGGIDNGTSGITTNIFTATTSVVPDASDGATLGSASLEWSDLYLADGAQILFGDDQEIAITHVADVGLTFSHETSGSDNKPFILTLESEEDDIVNGDIIAGIEFKAGDSGGSDAILPTVGIFAVATDTFAATKNQSKLVFRVAQTETAGNTTGTFDGGTDDMTLDHGGNLTIPGELDAATGDFSGAVDIAGDLTLSAGGDGALVFGTAGQNSIKIPDNQASALIIEQADNAYMTFKTTNSSELVTVNKAFNVGSTFQLGGTSVTATAAEINLIDGGTSRTTNDPADGDGLLHNNGGTMEMTKVENVANYMTSKHVAAREKVFILDNGETDVSSSDNITYVVSHNFSSRNVMVEVYRNGSNSGNYQTVYVDVTRSADDDVTIVFGSARTAGDYTAILRKIG